MFRRLILFLGIGIAWGAPTAGVPQVGDDSGAPACVLVADDPQLMSVPIDSVWVRGPAGFAACRVVGSADTWIVDYIWGKLASNPGRLFSMAQLDSLGRLGLLTGSMQVEVVRYRTALQALDAKTVEQVAAAQRPTTPPPSLVRACFPPAGLGSVAESSVVHENFADLDGDGTKEKIGLSCQRGAIDHYTLSVNEHRYDGAAEHLRCSFNVVDIDRHDRFKEIAIHEFGPSDDLQTTLIRYDKGVLSKLGTLPGQEARLRFDGSGLVRAEARGRVLHTWFYQALFRVRKGHIEQLVQPLYAMGTRCRVKQQFDLLQSPTVRTPVRTLVPGDSLTVVASDDRRWCLAMTTDRLLGWFEVRDSFILLPKPHFGGDVLDGLDGSD